MFSSVPERLRSSYDSLRQHKTRSILTILGIIIGITTVIALQSMVNGLNKTVERQFKSLGADMISVNLHEWGIRFGPRMRKPRPRLTMDDSEAIGELCPSVATVAPTLYEHQRLRYGSHTMRGVEVVGTTEPFTRIENYELDYGRFLTEADISRRKDVTVLGFDAALGLFGAEQPLGKRIRIGSRAYEVVGVLEEKGAIFGESLDELVIIPATTFEKQFGRLRTVNISVLPIDRAHAVAAREEIRILLRRRRKVSPGDPDNFAINTAQQLVDQYKQLTGVIFAAMVGIGGLSLLVGGIGIMNIMLVSVTERTREIGIRKALGATRREIRFQFLTEAVILCGIGGIIGVLLGVGLAMLTARLSSVPAAATPGTILIGLTFSSSVGLVFGALPAIRAARLNPIDALRHE